MDTLIQDIRYATRKLARTPGFTFIAVATLALAIGATTSVFSIVNGVLLKPLPFRDPEHLVFVASSDRDGQPAPMSTPDFLDYRNQSRSFVGMAALDQSPMSLTGNGMQPVRLQAAQVGARFFDLLGLKAERGRTFAANEDDRNAPHVAVLSDHLWRNQFGADERIVGQQIRLDGEAYTVVGIAPPSLTFPRSAELFVPFVFQPFQIDPNNRGAHSHFAIARVRDGVSVEAARSELSMIAKRLEKQYPETNTGFGATAMPLQERIVGPADKPLYAMFGAVAFVLLIACANVANLLLVRASVRESEMAVRTALGAGRSRIVRQLITESVLLSTAGAVVGTALAAWAVDAVVSFGPRGLPRLEEVAVDGTVLAFTLVLSVLTGIAFGLVPAVHAARPDIARMLRESVRGSSKGGAHRTRSALVVAEVSLAVVLLVGAGLLIRSFVELINVDPGFRPNNVVAFNLSLPSMKYQYERDVRGFVADLTQRLRRMPGTEAVGVTFGRPLDNSGMMRTSFEVTGWAPSTPHNRHITDVRTASPEYFQAMGIPLVRGRLFTPAEDRLDAPPTAVVTEAFVKKYFPNENPIGKKLTFGIQHDTAESGKTSITLTGEIVGVVGDVKQHDLASAPNAAAYVPFNNFAIGFLSMVVRSHAEPPAVESGIRAAVREIDRDLPVFGMATMKQAVSDSVAQPRFYMLLLAAFAAIALLLASLGIYGVISYTVSQRTRELGIRIALGASREKVVRLVLGHGVWLAGAGVVIGVLASLQLTRVLASLIFGVGHLDPLTFVAVPVSLLAVATVASYLPARRAARVDPVIAMRNE